MPSTLKEKLFLILIVAAVGMLSSWATNKINAVSDAASTEYVDSENKEQDIKNEKAHEGIITYTDKMDDKMNDKIDDTKTLFLDEIRLLRQDLKLKVDKN